MILKADDIFSFGCLAHLYLTKYHPFDLQTIKRTSAIPLSLSRSSFGTFLDNDRGMTERENNGYLKDYRNSINVNASQKENNGYLKATQL